MLKALSTEKKKHIQGRLARCIQALQWSHIFSILQVSSIDHTLKEKSFLKIGKFGGDLWTYLRRESNLLF